jgi:hypothetical protein
MVSVKSRRLAVPMVVACAGVFGSAATAHAAGGISVTPAALEHTAKRGTVGSLTVNNTTNETLRVTITVRPWCQELFGKVIVDTRTTLSRYVRASSRSFIMSRGARRTIPMRMLRGTRSGSLYGAVDVIGKPTRTKGRKGIIPNYRLISKIRLNASKKHKRYRLRTGAAQIRSGYVILPVRNLGNTIDPIGASYTLSGPTRRSGNALTPIAALPGKLIGLQLTGRSGLRKGRYTLTARVTQAGRAVNARTSFTIR